MAETWLCYVFMAISNKENGDILANITNNSFLDKKIKNKKLRQQILIFKKITREFFFKKKGI